MQTDKPKDAGAPEIELMSPMIEAGVRVLKENYLALADAALDEYPSIVRTVYEAMEAFRQEHENKDHKT